MADEEKVQEGENANMNMIGKDDIINEDTPLDKLANITMEGVGERRLKAVITIRRLLSKVEPPIDDVIESGVVPHLVDCVSSEEEESLQMEAAWALTNIASGSSDQTATVVKAGGVARFVQLMQTGNNSVREQVVWALGNISGDSAEYRDLVMDFGVVAGLSCILDDGAETMSVKRQASWLLSNLCRHKSSPMDIDTLQTLMPLYISGFKYHEDKEMLKDLCWGLSYLTEDGSEAVVQLVLDTDILDTVIELLADNDVRTISAAIRFVGNITTATDPQTQSVIDAGGLPKMKSLLSHPKDAVKKEVCWALSNIAAGTVDQKQALINNGIYPSLIDILTCDEETKKVKKEAAYALSNAAENGTELQINYLVGLGLIQTFIGAFEEFETRMVSVLFEGIFGILKCGKNVPPPNPYALMIAESPDLVERIMDQRDIHDDDLVQDQVENIMNLYVTPATKHNEEVEKMEDENMNVNEPQLNNKNLQLK